MVHIAWKITRFWDSFAIKSKLLFVGKSEKTKREVVSLYLLQKEEDGSKKYVCLGKNYL